MHPNLQSLVASQVDVDAYLQQLASEEEDKTADSALWLQNLSLEQLDSCFRQLESLYATEDLCTNPNLAFVAIRCCKLLMQSKKHFAEHGLRVALSGVLITPEDQSRAEVYRLEIPWSHVRPQDLDMLKRLSQLDFMQIDFIGPEYSTYLQSYANLDQAKSCGVTPDTERFLTMIGMTEELPHDWPYLADKDRWKSYRVSKDVLWQPFVGYYDENIWTLDTDQHIELHAQTDHCMPTFMLRFCHKEEPDAFDFDDIH